MNILNFQCSHVKPTVVIMQFVLQLFNIAFNMMHVSKCAAMCTHYWEGFALDFKKIYIYCTSRRKSCWFKKQNHRKPKALVQIKYIYYFIKVQMIESVILLFIKEKSSSGGIGWVFLPFIKTRWPWPTGKSSECKQGGLWKINPDLVPSIWQRSRAYIGPHSPISLPPVVGVVLHFSHPHPSPLLSLHLFTLGPHVLPDPAHGKICLCPFACSPTRLSRLFPLSSYFCRLSAFISLTSGWWGGWRGRLSCPNNTNRSLRKEERGGRRQRRQGGGEEKKRKRQRETGPKIGGLTEQIKKKKNP